MIKLPYIRMCGCEQPQCLCRLIYWKRTISFCSQKLGCKFHFIANSWQRTTTSYFAVFPMWCITTHTTLLVVVCTVKLTGQIQQPYRLNTSMFLLSGSQVFQDTLISKFLGIFRRRFSYTTTFTYKYLQKKLPSCWVTYTFLPLPSLCRKEGKWDSLNSQVKIHKKNNT